MSTWSKDELRRIAESDDLHIAPFREDGKTYGTPTWIWSVVVGDALYVRAYNGRDSRWYQAAPNRGGRARRHVPLRRRRRRQAAHGGTGQRVRMGSSRRRRHRCIALPRSGVRDVDLERHEKRRVEPRVQACSEGLTQRENVESTFKPFGGRFICVADRSPRWKGARQGRHHCLRQHGQGQGLVRLACLRRYPAIPLAFGDDIQAR